MQEREEEFGRMSLYMPKDLSSKIRQRAKEQKRSVNQVAVLIIEEFFNQEARKESAHNTLSQER